MLQSTPTWRNAFLLHAASPMPITLQAEGWSALSRHGSYFTNNFRLQMEQKGGAIGVGKQFRLALSLFDYDSLTLWLLYFKLVTFMFDIFLSLVSPYPSTVETKVLDVLDCLTVFTVRNLLLAIHEVISREGYKGVELSCHSPSWWTRMDEAVMSVVMLKYGSHRSWKHKMF